MSLSQLATRLDDQFWRLTAGGRTEIPRQRTLETVVAWSYDLLSEAEQHALTRLAVFPDHFTLEMAEAVVSDPPIDEPDVIDIVSHLVGRSLVTTVNAPDGLRYQLLEMLRQYGRDRLTEHGDVDRFQQRLLGWAMSGIEQLESVIRTPAQDDALREATINAVTYRAAMRWAAAHGQQGAALRIASMVPLTHHRGERRAEILERLSQADRAGQLDDAAAGHAWAAVLNLAFEQGEWQASLQAGAEAAGRFEAARLPLLAAWARCLQAVGAWGAGQLAEADRLIGEVIAIFRREHDEMGLGYSLWLASLRSADLAAAKEMAAEAEDLLRRVGHPDRCRPCRRGARHHRVRVGRTRPGRRLHHRRDRDFRLVRQPRLCRSRPRGRGGRDRSTRPRGRGRGHRIARGRGRAPPPERPGPTARGRSAPGSETWRTTSPYRAARRAPRHRLDANTRCPRRRHSPSARSGP